MPIPAESRGIPSLIAVLLVGTLLYVPSFATRELRKEEGRRAIPAREMMVSGDFVLPTVWGEPYLNKPPLYYWGVAAAAALTGGVSEASTRLPAVIATILTALLVFGVGRRLGSARDGMIAALAFLIFPLTFEKGALGEVEAVLCFTLFLSTLCLWMGSGLAGSAAGTPADLGEDRHSLPHPPIGSRPGPQARRIAFLVLSGLALAAALLTKGPPTYVFFVAAALGIALAGREWRFLAASRFWLPIGLGTALAGVWVFLLIRRPETSGVLEHWAREVTRGQGGIGRYLAERGRFLVAVAAGFLPATAAALVAWRTESWHSLWERPEVRFIVFSLAGGLAFFALMPETRARYVFPLAPWSAVLAGLIASAALARSPTSPEHRRLRVAVVVIAVLGLAACGAALTLPVWPSQGVRGLGIPGYALVALLLALALVVLWRRPAAGPGLLLAFAMVAIARLVQLIEIVPQNADEHEHRADAARIEAVIPQDAPVAAHLRGEYNVLFYVDRTIRAVSTPEEATPGVLVVEDAEAERLVAEMPGWYRMVLQADMRGGRHLTVVEVRNGRR